LRYPEKYRLAMFRTRIDAIGKHDKKVKIALCKEDIKIRKALLSLSNGVVAKTPFFRFFLWDDSL